MVLIVPGKERLMKRNMMVVAAGLFCWQTLALAECGYVPTVELRNIGFSQIEGIYRKVTLYCPKAYLSVEVNNETRQKGAWASDMLDEDNDTNVCWLSGVPAKGDGKEVKLLSFTASYHCKNKTPSEWGEIKLGQVKYEKAAKVCTNPVLSCPTLMGQGLTVAIGNEPIDRNPRSLRACICPVTKD